MGKSFKERKLRVLLDKYIKDKTTDTDWLLKVVPDLVEIELMNMGDWAMAMLVGEKVVLNDKYEAIDLLSSLVHELWHLKQKREHPVRYWIFKIPFFRHKIEDSAEAVEAAVEDWIYVNDIK